MLRIVPLILLFTTVLCASAAEVRPNVLFILADDLGWADIGAQGIEKDIRTPKIDANATGGLRAMSGFVTAPQCVPSRAVLLSGRYISSQLSRSMSPPLPWRWPDCRTIPSSMV